MHTVRKNLILNILYQILIIIIPLITTPYVSRVLGSDGVGRYSYAFAIAYYFAIFAMLGVNNYGNRTIATVSGDKEKQSKTFWSIYLFQLFFAVISIVAYILYIIFLCNDKLLGWIMLAYVLSAAFDINWFFFGMEEFKITVARNSAVKLISIICIFLFVKNQRDIYIYAFVNVIGFLIAQIILWTMLRKYVSFVKINISAILHHVKPNLVLFIPIIAISLYKFMARIMLGGMSTSNEVGYYESCEKILQIPVALITALGTVMLPRISNMIADKKEKEGLQYMKKSLVLTLLVASPLSFGIMAVAREFVPWFYGNGFEKCIDIFQILMPSCLFLAFANVVRTQYLIPYKRDKVYIISVILGAIMNIIINVLLIPEYQSIGAAIGTFVAEGTVFFIQCFAIRKEINVFKYAIYGMPFIFFSLIMYAILIRWDILILDFFSTMVIKIIVGSIIYCALTGLFLLFLKKRKFQLQ